MLTVPRRGPEIAGLQVTEMVQLAPAARLAPQVLVSAKSMPEVRMSRICKSALPLLVMVMVWGEPTVSTGCGWNVRAAGVTVSVEAGGDCGEARTVSRGKPTPMSRATPSPLVSHPFNRSSFRRKTIVAKAASQEHPPVTLLLLWRRRWALHRSERGNCLGHRPALGTFVTSFRGSAGRILVAR
jgi:hypothetical protein